MTSPRRRLASRRREKETGPQNFSEPVFVLVGILRRPHGLRGEALISIETDFPDRLQKGVKLFLGEEYKELTIKSRRKTNNGLLLVFEELDRETLEAIRNEPLFTRVTDSPQLPEGQFYQHQLLGLEVLTEDGVLLGKLVEVIDTGANDVYIVRTAEEKEVLLPAIRDVIRKVDLENKKLIVHLLPGLLPED